ncbi:MAG: hydrolase protein [Patescibacteria group bacterium]|nr:hydrolase protein [Patescibacteria group bacterium]
MKNEFVTIATIQSSVSPDIQSNIQKTAKLVENAAKKGAQIICLQELYSTPYFPQYQKVNKDKFTETIPGTSSEVFKEIAKKYGVVIIVPIYEKEIKNGKTEYHNSAVVIDEKGKLLPTYRKIHIPQDPLFYEKNYFKQSNSGYKIYKTKFGNFAVLICYDQWFPEAARSVTLAGADLVFYPTAIGNILGVKEKEGDWHDAWETVMRGHAIANNIYVVAVNRVGIEDKLKFWGQSFICDAFGKVINRASKDKDQILISKVDLSANKSIREEWGFMRNRRTDTYNSIAKKK